jgi:hypothetical protein
MGSGEGMAMDAPLESSPPAAASRNLRMRNLAVGLSVAFLAALFYAIAIVKMGAYSLPSPP